MFEVNCLLVQEAMAGGVGGGSAGDGRTVVRECDGLGWSGEQGRVVGWPIEDSPPLLASVIIPESAVLAHAHGVAVAGASQQRAGQSPQGRVRSDPPVTSRPIP